MEITHQHTYPKSHLLNLRNHGNKKHGWNKNIRYVQCTQIFKRDITSEIQNIKRSICTLKLYAKIIKINLFSL